MDYGYRIDGGIGIVTLSGKKTFQEAKDAWERMRLSIIEDSLQAIIMLDRAVSMLKGYEVIELEQWITRHDFPRTVKVAIVDPRPPTQTNNWFGETVAFNRGWYNIAVFPDEGSAISWLDAPGYKK